MKAYQDRPLPSDALTVSERQNNAAISHTVVVEDIEDGFLDAAVGWQKHRSAFYARARFQMGIREEDYNA